MFVAIVLDLELVFIGEAKFFERVYIFFKYKLFMKTCRTVCHFIFSKQVNFA